MATDDAFPYPAPGPDERGGRKSCVTVTITDREVGVLIAVRNEGDPIPLDEQKTIFKALTRGKDGSEGAESTHLGLGLFIAHKIVAAHGGEISVKSSQKEGTTTSALLPKRFVLDDRKDSLENSPGRAQPDLYSAIGVRRTIRVRAARGIRTSLTVS